MIRVSLLSRACVKDDLEILQMMKENKSTAIMQEGTILHSLILENKLPSDIEIIDSLDYRNAKAKELKEIALSSGKIPLLTKDIERYTNLDLTAIKKVFEGCRCEVLNKAKYMGLYHLQGTTDAIKDSTKSIIDLKITNPTTFKNPVRVIKNSGYDIQVYLYMLLNGMDNASICFYNIDHNMFQLVDMTLESIKDRCQYLIETEGLPRLERVKQLIESGSNELERLEYII